MKNLIAILLVLVISSCKKEVFNPINTKEFSIHSISNGADYHIKVSVPENYNPETEKYATMYVLDGEENFSFVANHCEKISHANSTSNVLVVSIGYGYDRAVDYTPTNVNNSGGGGAEKFMLFIKDELIPKMEGDYAADTTRASRVIIGHSFGGLFAAFAFANYNQVFGNYLMLSPSLWFDDEILFKMEQQNRNINKENHQLVYMGLGQLENEGRMLAPFEAFYQQLENNYPDIAIKSHFVPRLDHMGSKNENIIEALNFYFQNR